jgi:flagellar biosynthesis regulator FlbT
MPLQLYIKPNETLIIGEALVRNGKRSIELVIVNSTPVLRGKFIARPAAAEDAWSAMHGALQELLLSRGKDSRSHRTVADCYPELMSRHEDLSGLLQDMLQCYLDGDFYAAIKMLVKMRESRVQDLNDERDCDRSRFQTDRDARRGSAE